MPSMGGARVVVIEERFVLSDQALEELTRRLAWTRLPTDRGMGWEQGVPIDWLHGLLGDWREFDFGALQRRLDGLRQFRAEVAGHGLHVVVAEGRGPDPIPLLLTHGWPGSFLEYLKVLPLLCSRRRPGGSVHGDRPIAARLRIQRSTAARRLDRTAGGSAVARPDGLGTRV